MEKRLGKYVEEQMGKASRQASRPAFNHDDDWQGLHLTTAGCLPHTISLNPIRRHGLECLKTVCAGVVVFANF